MRAPKWVKVLYTKINPMTIRRELFAPCTIIILNKNMEISVKVGDAFLFLSQHLDIMIKQT